MNKMCSLKHLSCAEILMVERWGRVLGIEESLRTKCQDQTLLMIFYAFFPSDIHLKVEFLTMRGRRKSTHSEGIR